MKLSIIIPTKNEEKYLPYTLSSLKRQTFKDFEIIIADGGSKDRTLKIAKKFKTKVVKGGNPAKGRNEGAKISKGKLLLFMDADNVFISEKFLEKVIFEFEKRKLDVAFFPILPLGNFFDKLIFKIYYRILKFCQKFFSYSFNSILIKKRLHQKIGGFDERIKVGEDFDYTRRASKIGKFGFIMTKPILTSGRRFEKKRFRSYLTYILAGLHFFFLGPPREKFSNYWKNEK